jgi:hypothetical protein
MIAKSLQAKLPNSPAEWARRLVKRAAASARPDAERRKAWREAEEVVESHLLLNYEYLTRRIL